MNRSQVNRARIAERATASTSRLPGTPRTKPTVGTNPAMRSAMPSHPMAAGVVRRSRALKMTGAQKNSLGRQSEWTRSPEFFTDPAWAYTASTMPRGER